MRNRSFLALCALILVNQIGFGIITPVLPAYARTFGLGAGAIGLVIGIYGFARFVANVPAGQLAERRGRRPVLIIGTIITAVAAALMATADSLPQLLAYRLLAGLGAATVITGGQIMVGDMATPENRGRMMSTYQGFFLFGVTAGPVAGGFLADWFSLRASFIAYAAFSAAAAVMAMVMIRETRPEYPPAPARTEADGETPEPESTHDAVRRTVFSAGFILVSAVSLTQFIGRTGALFTVVPLLGTETLNLSASDIGIAFTVVNILNIGTVYFSGAFADRYGRKPVIAPATLVAGLGMAMFAFSGSETMFMLSAAMWGLGAGISGPAPAAYVADLAPGKTRPQVFGYFRSVSDAGYIIGPIALGWITSQFGYHFPLLLTAGMIVVSGVLFWVFAPETHPRPSRKQNAPTA